MEAFGEMRRKYGSTPRDLAGGSLGDMAAGPRDTYVAWDPVACDTGNRAHLNRTARRPTPGAAPSLSPPMPALPADTLPELPAPRGYVPAAEPPPLPRPGAGAIDLEQPGAPSPDPADRLTTMLADAAAARARMAYTEAAERCAAGAALARELGAEGWARRFADEAQAIGLLSPPPIDPGTVEAALPEVAPGTPADGPGRGRQRLNAAIGRALAGEPGSALAEIEAAEGALDAGDGFGRLLVRLNRAQALLDHGDLRAAVAAAADALRMARREKDEYGTALAGLGSALTHLARGRRNEARAHLGEAARTFARYGDALRQVQCHYLLGEVAYTGEDPIRAGAHYRDALAVARPAGAQEWIELLTLRFEHR
ncbi:MAG TPA: tetratricopeptide repeat protein [Longimicrobium sp.]|nr:tetratricopeptide repeat protein [Longimicrobium sp.]